MPVVIDRGSILDQSGKYRLEWLPVFESLKLFNDTHLALIHTRRPNLDNLIGKSPEIALYSLRQIDLQSTKLLLYQALKQREIKATVDELNQLAQYMDGYPPVINWAVNRIVTYGLPMVLSNQRELSDFKAKAFIGMLRDLDLRKEEWEILRLLSGLGALPIEAIDALAGTSRDETVVVLGNLIDLSLVYPTDSYYEIAGPIRYAVNRVRGPISKVEYQICAKSLREVFWQEADKIPAIRIVDATIQALTFSGMAEADEFRDLIIPSRLVSMAQKLYDSHNRFDPNARRLAIELTRRALEIDPSLNFAREILFKSYVREELWGEAERVLQEIEDRRLREAFYLRGFYNWKRGRLGEASTSFQTARRAGDRSIRLIRDFAGCLFYLGKIPEARAVIKDAPDYAFRNPFVIDLAAQIAIELKDWGDAEHRLDQLTQFGTEADVHHRRATLLLRQNKPVPALSEADLACSDGSGPFEFFGQRAKILIELRNENARNEVERLRPGNIGQRDVCRGLRCELALKDLDWKAAESIWTEIQQKNLPVHQVLYKKILILKLTDQLLSPIERQRTEDELHKFAATPDMFAVLEDVESDIEGDELEARGETK